MGDYTIVRDVSGEDKNKYFILFHSKKKIYPVVGIAEINLVRALGSDVRWYDKEINEYFSKGYVLTSKLI